MEGSANPGSAPATPAREALVAFLAGARAGFRERDLATWCRRFLLAKGLLRPRDALSGRIVLVEADAGKVDIPTSPTSTDRDRDEAARISDFARRRALEVLRLLTQTPPDDRFLNAAIQSGRVARTAVAGQRRAVWTPQLQEGDSLSYMLVTLLAADALDNRSDYERLLRICRVCGDVGFDAEICGRSGCPDHPSTVPRRAASNPELKPPTSQRTPPTSQRDPGQRDALRDSAQRRQHSAFAMTEPAMKAVKPEE